VTPAVVVTGAGLTPGDVRTVARDGAAVSVAPAAVDRAERAWRTVTEVAQRQVVYGRGTGVGANRDIDVTATGDGEHGLRVLRSHAAGAGPLLDAARTRAMLVVRLNQLAAGGSGVEPGILDVLAAVLNQGLLPPVHSLGGIGTGDLTALASTALCVLGERPWRGGTLPPYPMDPADSLAFISSNAATVGEACLGTEDLRDLLDASVVVAALAFVAVDGSTEPYAEAVHAARPHVGQRAVAARMRELVGDTVGAPARVQDPYSYRAIPQVHGPAVEACGHLSRVLAVELNAACENPLVDVSGQTVWHNGNFHGGYVGLALDTIRAALFSTAALSGARLSTLVEPRYTGLRPFLADGPPASSGVMILEYVSQSALAQLRHNAAATGLATAVVSRGLEEHAAFSVQAARNLTEVVESYRVMLCCELVAAVRALRMRAARPHPGPLRDAFDRAAEALDPRTEDRPLDADLAAAAQVLSGLGRQASERL
jgi:histidine ammonia-lyase